MKYLVLLLATFGLSGTSSAAERFPTFHEFIGSEWWVSLSEDPESYLDLVKRTSFNDTELDQLFSSTRIEKLIVVYRSAHSADPRGPQALRRAMQLEPDNPLLAFIAANECLSSEPVIPDNQCGHERFEHFLGLDPTNMLAHYMLTAYWYTQQDYDRALAAIRDGNDAPGFESYFRPLFTYPYAAARSFGFPTYISNRIAFRGPFLTFYTHPLIRMCENAPGRITERDEFVAHCLEMGQRIERGGSTILEKALALATQRKTLEGNGGAPAELLALAERRDALDQWTEQMPEELPLEAYTEEIDAQFFRDLIELGEIPALQRKAESLKHSVGPEPAQ